MSFVFQDIPIVSNPAVWESLRSGAFTRGRLAVWATYRFDAWRAGKNADAWRATSLVLHCINAVILFAVAVQVVGLVPSLITAALFIAHPLTLMSTQYVAGRSGVLGGMAQLVVVFCILSGWLAAGLVVTAATMIWVKEDMCVLIPMIAALLWL